MKLLLHDLDTRSFQEIAPFISEQVQVIGPKEKGLPHHCIGCFGCWTKTPGHCVIRDGYGDMSTQMGTAEEFIIISRMTYGGFSPFVKTVLDRNIGYILPFFCTRNGEMHHKLRYHMPFSFTVFAYGEHINQAEVPTMETLIQANALNFGASETRFRYFRQEELASKWKENIG